MAFSTLLVTLLTLSGVLGQNGWGVTYTPKRICALKGSPVDMRCTYSYPTSHKVQKAFWFIRRSPPQEPEDLSQDPEYSGRVKLTVTALQVRMNPGSVTEGQSVTLTCKTTCTLTGSPVFTCGSYCELSS
ncbi:hypothetical protein COCON_G00236530 [Conger conger]|uniref:Uncharacterized protein n=1 Tax=Conger conger TaxID=82655 RepID=A0A9Q1CU49_CONCO|nr:hypothetical protein COCON_G00236530 [Conger conger]